MPTHTIDTITQKTTPTGKTVYKLTVQGKNVDAWASNWPGGFTPGQTVEGEIVTKVNGKFTNHTLYPPRGSNGAEATRSQTPVLDLAAVVAALNRIAAALERSLPAGSPVRAAGGAVTSTAAHDEIPFPDVPSGMEGW